MLQAFAASRLFYLFVGALLARVVQISPLQSHTSIFPLGTLSIWANFDGEHYVSVAEGGYDEESQACFPYPGLVRLAAALFGGPVSPGALSFCGALISLVAFCFALCFVYRIAEEGWGTRAAQGVVLSLACFPTSFFFNAVYTESLFLALSAGAVWAARVRNDLLLDSFLAGLAAATRSVGVLLLIRRIRYDCPSLAGPRILLATGMYATICRVCNCKLGPSAEEDEELYGAAPRGRAQLVSY